ncbi:MAG: hypothetical protein J6X66_06560 [Lachnospiraceae bacterium]|nr:hypothetical protein [Lachnospiraceae bacterium]
MDKDQYRETLEVLQTLVEALNGPKGIMGYVAILNGDTCADIWGYKSIEIWMLMETSHAEVKKYGKRLIIIIRQLRYQSAGNGENSISLQLYYFYDRLL